MKAFMDDNFLLENETARGLYHNYAKDMPIFDYHSHLIPEQIADNLQFANLHEVWLSGDHYKWRAMRSFGIDETYITGSADPFDKFLAYSRMIPHAIGNPLYHWTHLELRRYFGIKTLLSEKSAAAIWEESAAILKEKRSQDFLTMFRVWALCTTDDPADELMSHRAIAADPKCTVRVLPTFRPDKAMAAGNYKGWREYLERLGMAAGLEIRSYSSLVEALERRHEYFHGLGCRLSDHALTTVSFDPAKPSELESIFARLFSGKQANVDKLQSALLQEFSNMNRRRGWAMQLHIGALRNTNSRMFTRLGPDSGYDSISDAPLAAGLAGLLNSMEEGGLPKTIIYVLNPADNYVVASMIGNFQDGQTAGKIQFGSGWWFNDQRDGMVAQMKALANLGLLSQFVGMLTDSRSFLSFPRHEYFRRILCNLVGGWVEGGEYPWNEELLGEMIQNICFRNAKNYFGVD